VNDSKPLGANTALQYENNNMHSTPQLNSLSVLSAIFQVDLG